MCCLLFAVSFRLPFSSFDFFLVVVVIVIAAAAAAAAAAGIVAIVVADFVIDSFWLLLAYFSLACVKFALIFPFV